MRMITATVAEVQNDFERFLQYASEGSEVTITKDGKAVARLIPQDKAASFMADSLRSVLKTDYDDKADHDEMVQAVRQAKAIIALNEMRCKAAACGFMSDEEIEAEINAARNEDIYLSTTSEPIRIDSDIKQQVADFLDNLGLDLSQAVNIFLHQCVLRGGLPFPVELPQYNAETLEAMAEAKCISADESVKGYTSMEELKAALDE